MKTKTKPWQNHQIKAYNCLKVTYLLYVPFLLEHNKWLLIGEFYDNQLLTNIWPFETNIIYYLSALPKQGVWVWGHIRTRYFLGMYKSKLSNTNIDLSLSFKCKGIKKLKEVE